MMTVDVEGPTVEEDGGALSRLNVLLLALWLVVMIIGFNVKGLFWLGIIGLVLCVGTGVVAAISIEDPQT